MLVQQKNNKPFSAFQGKGFSIIEVLIAISLITIAFINFLGIVSFSLKSARFVKRVNQANFLAQETVEATRSFRDNATWGSDGLGGLLVDTDYYPSLTAVNTPSWSMTLGQEVIGDFSRKVVFYKVSRDPVSFDIESVYNSSNDDPNTRKAVATVYFDSRSIELTTYFTNWQEL
jgi:prepilin-type N-terminal cleavage/methylation domain-containing protein